MLHSPLFPERGRKYCPEQRIFHKLSSEGLDSEEARRWGYLSLWSNAALFLAQCWGKVQDPRILKAGLALVVRQTVYESLRDVIPGCPPPGSHMLSQLKVKDFESLIY